MQPLQQVSVQLQRKRPLYYNSSKWLRHDELTPTVSSLINTQNWKWNLCFWNVKLFVVTAIIKFALTERRCENFARSMVIMIKIDFNDFPCYFPWGITVYSAASFNFDGGLLDFHEGPGSPFFFLPLHYVWTENTENRVKPLQKPNKLSNLFL